MAGLGEAAAKPAPMQIGLLAETELAVVKGVNVEQIVGDIREPLDEKRFEAAWAQVVEEFDVFRMSLRRVPRGAVHANFAASAELSFSCFDWSDKPLVEQERFFERHLIQDRERRVPIDRAPAMRVQCFVLDESHWRLLWTFHHSLLDGFAYSLAIKRLFEVYDAAVSGAPIPMAKQPSYEAYLRWLATQGHDDGAAFFESLLKGFAEPTPLPFGRRNQTRSGRLGGEVTAVLPGGETKRLKDCAKELGVTPNTVSQFCWGLLLSRYSGRMDVVFGATWSGRSADYENSDRIAGVFMNTTPVRMTLDKSMTVREALRRLRAQHVETRQRRRTPIALTHERSDVPADQAIFESVVVFDRERFGRTLRKLGGNWDNRRFRLHSRSGTPLILCAHFEGDRFVANLEYREDVLSEEQAHATLAHYLGLIRNVVASPNATAWDLSMLRPDEREQLISTQVAREVGDGTPPVMDLIEQVACDQPDAVALESPSHGSMTYRGLMEAADAFALDLQSRGGAPGAITAIKLRRSMEAVVAMLGCMKAGVAFMPVDPSYPKERIQYLLDDSRASFAVTEEGTDVLRSSQPSTSERTAYVIYTSGSTGKPKGVCVSHDALANHCAAIRTLYELKPRDRVLQFASLSFDVALEEIVPTLASGATLVIRDASAASSVSGFFDFVEQKRLSVLNLPTAFWHALVQSNRNRPWPRRVRLLIVGGEQASKNAHDEFRRQESGHVRWINGYGPTEATITSTVYDDSERDDEAALPIGRPVEAVSHFVLDEHMRVLPRGAVGQLFIGGAGLAEGYLHKPELTEGAFIEHPFRNEGRLYATGDLVFLTKRGNFVFVDRADRQIKIRGFRIELGEIEAQLSLLPSVTEVAVIADTSAGRDPSLEAHLVTDDSSADMKRLRELLIEQLPPYMVPASFQLHDALPKTVSGKVDHRALVKSSRRKRESKRPSHPPSNQPTSLLHKQVLDVWIDILDRSDIELGSDFFELGGSSLLMLELFAEVERYTRRKPNPGAFLRKPTLEQMLRLLRRDSASDWSQVILKMAEGDGTVRPLFLAPGVSGAVSDYVHLVAMLDRSIPVYGLQFGRMSDDPRTALRRYACGCVTRMKNVQPAGPYAIAGYSAGGIVSLAIAEMLQEQDEQVDFLGILDGTPPLSVRLKSPLSSPARFVRFGKSAASRTLESLADSGYAGFRDRAARALARGYPKWIAQDQKHLGLEELFGEGAEVLGEHLGEKLQRHLDAISGFQHRPFQVDAVLFRTALDPFEGPHEPDLGWEHVIGGAISIEVVPGKHAELLMKDHASVLALRMNPYLLSRHEP